MLSSPQAPSGTRNRQHGQEEVFPRGQGGGCGCRGLLPHRDCHLSRHGAEDVASGGGQQDQPQRGGRGSLQDRRQQRRQRGRFRGGVQRGDGSRGFNKRGSLVSSHFFSPYVSLPSSPRSWMAFQLFSAAIDVESSPTKFVRSYIGASGFPSFFGKTFRSSVLYRNFVHNLAQRAEGAKERHSEFKNSIERTWPPKKTFPPVFYPLRRACKGLFLVSWQSPAWAEHPFTAHRYKKRTFFPSSLFKHSYPTPPATALEDKAASSGLACQAREKSGADISFPS